MAFTVGTGTFTNGSATVTNVSLSSGTLAYFASGTRMVVGANPVTAEVEAVAAPTVTTITLRSPWPHTGGTYNFLANQTSEGLRDAVQSIRTSNTTLQDYIDSISKAPNADTVVERTSTGSARVANAQNADEAVAKGQFPAGFDFDGAYAKNNILGAVSQTGGVPTGAIIERGSNASGEYMKLADGTLICWQYREEPISSYQSYLLQGITVYDVEMSFAFPAFFIEQPVLSCEVNFLGGGDNFQNASVSGATGKSSAVFILSSLTNSGTAVELFFMAIGRWY